MSINTPPLKNIYIAIFFKLWPISGSDFGNQDCSVFRGDDGVYHQEQGTYGLSERRTWRDMARKSIQTALQTPTHGRKIKI